MAKIYQNLTDLIGRTPLLQLNNYGAVKALQLRLSQSWNTSIHLEV